MTLQRYESEMRSRGNDKASDRARALRLEHGDVPLDALEITAIETSEQAASFARHVTSQFAENNGIENHFEGNFKPFIEALRQAPEVHSAIFIDGHRKDDNYPRLETFVFMKGDVTTWEIAEAKFASAYFDILPRNIADSYTRFRKQTTSVEQLAQQAIDNRTAIGGRGTPIALATFKR